MAARRGHQIHQGLARRQRRKLVDGAAATRDAELRLGGPRARSHAAVADEEFQSPWRPIGAGHPGPTAIVRGRTLCRHRSIPKWTRDHSSRRQHSAGGWRLSGQPGTSPAFHIQAARMPRAAQRQDRTRRRAADGGGSGRDAARNGSVLRSSPGAGGAEERWAVALPDHRFARQQRRRGRRVRPPFPRRGHRRSHDVERRRQAR